MSRWSVLVVMLCAKDYDKGVWGGGGAYGSWLGLEGILYFEMDDLYILCFQVIIDMLTELVMVIEQDNMLDQFWDRGLVLSNHNMTTSWALWTTD